MKPDPYEDFAHVYDAWQRLYPQPFSMAMAPLIRQAVERHGAPSPVLADLACGTGTFALWWKRRFSFWTVYGTDRSAAMIRMAKAEIAASSDRLGRSSAGRGSAGQASTRRGSAPQGSARQGSARRGSRNSADDPVRFLVQDLKDLDLPEPVGVATCLFDSLNHVMRRPDLGRIFRRVHRSLAPGGLFLFDLIEELTFPEVFSGSSIFDGKDLYLGMETEYNEERGHGVGIARFTFFRQTGVHWKRIDFRIRERRWFRGEIRDLLSDVGLELLKLEKINPYTSKDFFVPRTFWVCRRPR